MMNSIKSIRRLFYATVLPALIIMDLLVGRQAGAGERAVSGLAQSVLQADGATPSLCAHVSAGDGSFCVELAKGGARFVHGICASSEEVDRARGRVQTEGQGGRVGVEYASPGRLPYSDDLLNALVFSDFAQCPDQAAALSEALRVVAPGGYTYLEMPSANAAEIRKLLSAQGSIAVETERLPAGWVRMRKPRRPTQDEWPQLQHGPDGNPVSKDTEAGVPVGVRWLASPLWPFGGRKTVVRGVVSAGGRLFYIHEDAPSTTKYVTPQLVARDAYNGLQLWKLKSGGSALLLADDTTVWHVLVRSGPLVALDAATGKVKHTYTGLTGLEEVVKVDNTLVVKQSGVVSCINAETGAAKWTTPVPASSPLSGLLTKSSTMVVDGNQILFCVREPASVMSLDLATGREIWRSGKDLFGNKKVRISCLYEGVLALADDGGGTAIALSAKDGSQLWSYTYSQREHGGSPVKISGVGGLLWVRKAVPGKSSEGLWEGLDPATGAVKKSFPLPPGKYVENEERCCRDRATVNLVISGAMNFFDIKSGKSDEFRGARHACGSGGILPANGLIYTFPHGCACFDVIRGFMGLASKPRPPADGAADDKGRLETGPAYGQASVSPPGGNDWPTYRGNAFRNSTATSTLPVDLKLLWSVNVSGNYPAAPPEDWKWHGLSRITSPTVAEGKVLVAAPDLNLITAVDAQSGKPLWSYATAGRVDTPPTLYRGLCLFGCRDGWIYGLEMSSGRLAWRFRAAPFDERVAAYGQLESPWPVAGGVLVFADQLFAVAGRHGRSDGGMRICALDPLSGKLHWEQNLTDENLLADLLLADQGSVCLSGLRFHPKTGAVTRPSGKDLPGQLIPGRLSLADSAWYNHGYGLRRRMHQWSLGPSILGTLLAFDQKTAYGFISGFGLTHDDKHIENAGKIFARKIGDPAKDEWTNALPEKARIKSLVVAGQTVIATGIAGAERKNDAFVWFLSAENGKNMGELKLDVEPVHEGVAVAGERLYVCAEDGNLRCFGK